MEGGEGVLRASCQNGVTSGKNSLEMPPYCIHCRCRKQFELSGIYIGLINVRTK